MPMRRWRRRSRCEPREPTCSISAAHRPECVLFPYRTLFRSRQGAERDAEEALGSDVVRADARNPLDRKSTRLNSSHASSSYIVFCLRTEWRVASARLHGLRLPTFAKRGLTEPLTIQSGRTRSFLVGVSHYSPPRE